jgi:hypothetical protein
MKIVDKINAAIAAKQTFFSFEYFPPRTEEVSRRAACVCNGGIDALPRGGGGRANCRRWRQETGRRARN